MKSLLVLWFVVISVFGVELENEKNLDLQNGQDIEAQNSMKSWLNSEFALKPYKPNYLLPFGYANKDYESYSADEYQNIEAEIQISLKLPVTKNLLGMEEMYYLAYSHKAFWQIYTDSSPFRETNYNPEGFIVFPIFNDISDAKLRTIKVALAHESNGQGEVSVRLDKNGNTEIVNRSRSINYFYTEATFQYNNLLMDLRFLAPSFGESNLSDNKDIMDYWGYTALKLRYFNHKSIYTFMIRGNTSTGYGAVEATYSYPLLKDKTYIFAKFFNGYGESLIDYNNFISKFSIGIAFSR